MFTSPPIHLLVILGKKLIQFPIGDHLPITNTHSGATVSLCPGRDITCTVGGDNSAHSTVPLSVPDAGTYQFSGQLDTKGSRSYLELCILTMSQTGLSREKKKFWFFEWVVTLVSMMRTKHNHMWEWFKSIRRPIAVWPVETFSFPAQEIQQETISKRSGKNFIVVNRMVSHLEEDFPSIAVPLAAITFCISITFWPSDNGNLDI